MTAKLAGELSRITYDDLYAGHCQPQRIHRAFGPSLALGRSAGIDPCMRRLKRRSTTGLLNHSRTVWADNTVGSGLGGPAARRTSTAEGRTRLNVVFLALGECRHLALSRPWPRRQRALLRLRERLLSGRTEVNADLTGTK